MSNVSKKLYNILDPKTESNILGGAVPRENAYFTQYFGGEVAGDVPRLNDLEVGQSTLGEFSGCGQKPLVHKIVRVE